MSSTARLLADRWDFEPQVELEGGWCSHVYADERRVLKCPWRGEEITSGYRASIELAGWLGPEIYESDPTSGSILMSRVLPGTNLNKSAVSEAEALSLVARLIETLRGRISPAGYPTLRNYYQLEHPLLDELISTSPESVFLHGDLHHFNILRASDSWCVIDPKGLSGDPCYEAIAFLRNNVREVGSQVQLVALLRARLTYFSQRLNFSPWRMAAWGLIDQLDSGDDSYPPLVHAYESLLEEAQRFDR